MELIERKIGETFEYEGKKLRVEKSDVCSCDGCFFIGQCMSFCKEITGQCEAVDREDSNNVIFVEILNLCEILKNCPKDEKFWSPLLGDVKLFEVNPSANVVIVTETNLTTWRINQDATMTINDNSSPEIMLYPSKTQRDWSKVKYEKKEKFDPMTLQPFDRVIARSTLNSKWRCTFFSHLIDDERRVLKCITSDYSYPFCIPYNDETKHLAGTTEEAPEYYRYWEN